jgi:separase
MAVLQAPKALELCCHAIWAHVRFSYRGLSSRTEENRTMEHLPKDTLKDIIFDAFARLAKMVEILHRCGSKRTHEIIAMSLSKLLADDMSEYFDSSLILIKLWVKVLSEKNSAVYSSTTYMLMQLFYLFFKL